MKLRRSNVEVIRVIDALVSTTKKVLQPIPPETEKEKEKTEKESK